MVVGLVGEFVVGLIDQNGHPGADLLCQKTAQLIAIDGHARRVIGVAEIDQAHGVIDCTCHGLEINGHVVTQRHPVHRDTELLGVLKMI